VLHNKATTLAMSTVKCLRVASTYHRSCYSVGSWRHCCTPNQTCAQLLFHSIQV